MAILVSIPSSGIVLFLPGEWIEVTGIKLVTTVSIPSSGIVLFLPGWDHTTAVSVTQTLGFHPV